jgi:hypothetical protein
MKRLTQDRFYDAEGVAWKWTRKGWRKVTRSAAKRLAIIATIAFSACSQLQQFTATDVANAGVIATKSGDAAGAQCWGALGGAVMASPDPTGDGLAVLVERYRLAQGVAAGPCAPVILPIILQLQMLGLRVPLGGL